jgi:hypothetical protein
VNTHTRHNLCLSLLPPFRHLGIDLVPKLRLDLACITRKQGKETLRARIDHVDFVQRNRVHNLFAFLNFAFGALDEFCLWVLRVC